MKFQKQLLSWVLCTFCFCLTLGALNTSAHAASVSCKTCGADLGSPVFKAKYDHYYCSACGKWFYYIFSVSAESGVEFVSVSPATCTSSGQGQYVCSTHGKGPIVTSESPLEHDWTVDHCIPAACLTPGSIDYVCSGCGETKQETIPALEHDWKEASRQDATCTASGMIYWECSRCDATQTETISALGGDHIWEETGRTDATQIAAGSVDYTCITCGAFRSEYIPYLGIDLTISGLLEDITGIFSACLVWVGIAGDMIARNPILLLVVVAGFIGTGVVLFRRILKL